MKGLLLLGKLANQANFHGEVPLMVASARGDEELAKYILQEGCNPTTRNSLSRNALYHAVCDIHTCCASAVYPEGALEGLFNTIFEHGHDAGNFAFRWTVGHHKRRNSWPSELESSKATLARKFGNMMRTIQNAGLHHRYQQNHNSMDDRYKIYLECKTSL